MPERYILLVLLMPIFLVSLCVHELAHAWVASRRGDPTPVQAGRLSLLPWAHWDWIGTIFLPAACFLSGIPAFGWAKPVPVDARNFRHPRFDMALVAAAGPASNLLLCLGSALALSFFHPAPWSESSPQWIQTGGSLLEMGLLLGMQANLALAFFNLIPLPPLDGSVILQSVLPVRAITVIQRLAPLSLVVIALLYFGGGLSFITVPIRWCFNQLIQWAVL